MAAPGQDGAAATTTTSQRAIARNFGAFAIAQVVVRLAGLGAVVVLARMLSSQDFGRYSVALALSTMVTLVVELGMGNYLVREGTQAPARLDVVVGHVLVIQAGLGAVAVAVCAAVAMLLGYDQVTFWAVVLLALASVLQIAQRSLMAVLVALDRAQMSAAFQSGQAAAQAALTVVAALLGAGPAGIAAVVLLTTVLSWPPAQLLLLRHWSGGVRLAREGFWRTVRIGAAYSTVRLGYMMLTYVDTVMVQAISGNTAAAEYSAAYRLMLALTMVPSVYTDSVTQPVAQLAKHDRDALAEIYGRAASQLLIIGLPIGVGGLLLGEPIMSTVFGPEYAAAGSAAGLLFLGLVLAFPAQLMAVVALTIGLERRVAIVFMATLAVNVAANIVLIPAHGTVGAAIAMLIATAMLFCWLGAILWRLGMRPHVGARILKAAVAAAAMAGVVVAAGELPLGVLILLGAIVYLVLIAALRTFDGDDLELLPFGARLRALRAERTTTPG